MESRNGASSRPARSMVNARGEFTGAHNPAAPHWSQIQHLAIRMTLFCRDVAACLRAARPSHVASQRSSKTIGFLPSTSMRVDSASGSMWVGLVNFVVDNFPEHSRYWHRPEIPMDRLRPNRMYSRSNYLL